MAERIKGFKAAHRGLQKVSLGKKGSFSLHKGALHRALGVPEGQKIPAKKMAQARRSKSQHVRNMARSAAGLKAMGKR